MKFEMKSTFRSLFVVVVTLMMAVILTACGGGEKEAEQHNSDHRANSQSARVAQQSATQSGNEADTIVNVVARDFEFSLDSSSVAAGTVSFIVTNEGAMPHDFAITTNGERYKTEMIKPGASGSLTVELLAGSYEYICTIPGHDVLGMKGTFTVN
jgi:plastocyanin